MTKILDLGGLNRLTLAKKLGATFDFQQEIIACRDKYRTVVKPRQAGMTTAFAIETLIDSIIRDNYVTCIVSPTKRQSDRMMRYIKKALMKLERSYKTTIPTQKFTNEEVFFHHGSEIYSLPNNPAGIQGIDCDNGIVDEAGLFAIKEGEAVMDALVGSLSAKQGRLTISGKPRGKRGMLWQYWDPSEPRYKEFTHFKITWQDRARQDRLYGKEVQKHRRILPKLQFAETYDAEFIDEGILVFPHELLEKSYELWRTKKFVLMMPEGKPQDNLPTFMGMDFGRKRNLTEIHVLQQLDKSLLRTLCMKSLRNMNFENQKVYIDDMIARLKPIRIVLDEHGLGQSFLDYYQGKFGEKCVIPMRLSNAPMKEKIILQCQNAFTDLRLAIPDNDDLYTQLHSFQKEYTDHGNVRYFGKVTETDFLDDKVIALAAAVHAAEQRPFGFGII